MRRVGNRRMCGAGNRRMRGWETTACVGWETVGSMDGESKACNILSLSGAVGRSLDARICVSPIVGLHIHSLSTSCILLVPGWCAVSMHGSATRSAFILSPTHIFALTSHSCPPPPACRGSSRSGIQHRIPTGESSKAKRVLCDQFFCVRSEFRGTLGPQTSPACLG